MLQSDCMVYHYKITEFNDIVRHVIKVNLHSNTNNTMAADRQEYVINVWEVVVAVSDIVVEGLTGRIS